MTGNRKDEVAYRNSLIAEMTNLRMQAMHNNDPAKITAYNAMLTCLRDMLNASIKRSEKAGE